METLKELTQSSSPIVSVIVVSQGKRPELLDECLKSVEFAAGYFHDDTGYDAQIILISNAGKTFGQNFNEALESVDAPLVRWVADDDWLTPDSLSKQTGAFAAGDYDFMCANAILFGQNVGEWHDKVYKSQVPASASVLAMHNSIHGGTMMYRTEVLRAVGGFDESLITGEEWELNMRLLSRGYKLGYLDAVVYYNRLHDGQKSGGGITQPRDFKDKHERRAYLARIAAKYI